MKNYIPLVLAVLLGIAAVVAVSRVLRERQGSREATTSVVAAGRQIEAGSMIEAGMIREKSIPVMARPEGAVPWSKRALILGQTTMRAVSPGDYILTTDIETGRGASSLIGAGEWAVTLQAGGGIAQMVQPGDEVAIVATLSIEREIPQADMSKSPLTEEKEITTVLFPKVRILHSGANEPGRSQAARSIVVALPPQQAQMLIAAQRKADLELALRKPDDDTSIDRKELGMVDSSTFTDIIKDMKNVVLPDIPATVK